jgi:[ribosomal protein S18]-alanine N-acetyltransferase
LLWVGEVDTGAEEALLQLEIRSLTRADADTIAGWRYPGPYSTYDVREVVTPAGGYWAVEHEENRVGYCCFGPPARVPGVDEEEGTLDVGYGMRPDLMGQSLGRSFVGAILNFAVNEFAPQKLRLLILEWNERSQRVAKALGFSDEGTLQSEEGPFRVMVRLAG